MSFTVDYVTYTVLNSTQVSVTGYSSPPSNWNLVIPSTVTNASITYNVVTIK